MSTPAIKLTRAKYGPLTVCGTISDQQEITTISCQNWVNVIVFTNCFEIIFIKQFRFGSNSYTIEFPGGIVDTNDPLTSAKQELLEETGYESDTWFEVAHYSPNPALFDNRCVTYACTNAAMRPNYCRLEASSIEVLALKSHQMEIVRSELYSNALMATPILVARSKLVEPALSDLLESFFPVP